MLKKSLKKLLALGCACAMLTVGLAGCADSGGNGGEAGGNDWPNKTITVVVPYNAGGDTDFHARNLATYLKAELGVEVVVQNVAGANGTTGMLQVRDANPDGYTALFFHDSMLTNKVTGVSDTAHEALTPVAATIVDNSYIMAVNSKSGMESLQDVVDKAKADPGKMLYASSVGGYSYYLGRQLEELAGIDFNIVDAGGGTDRNAALLANKIDTNVNPYGVMKSYIDSGDFKALCTISDERNPLFPDVPTAKEQGFDWSGERNYFLSFPKDTDQEIVDKMAEAIEKICSDEEFIKSTEEAYCVTPTYRGPEELKKVLDEKMAEFEENKELVNN